jgi:hypothetical protein
MQPSPIWGCQQVNTRLLFKYDQNMFQFGNRIGNSSGAFLAINLILIALIAGAYFYRGISFGFTVLMLLVLALAVFSAIRSVKPQEQKLRRVMKATATLSLAIDALITALHYLHR